MGTAAGAIMSSFLRVSAITLTLSTATYLLYILSTRQPDLPKTKKYIQKTVAKVETQDWTNLKSDFTLPIRLFLTESLLEKGWNIVYKSFGTIERVGDPIITPGWLLTAVKIPLKLQHAEFALQLQMTSGGSLVGFHFTGLGNGWKVPSYASDSESDTDPAIVESEMILGQGRFKVGATLCLPQNPSSTPGPKPKRPSKFPCAIFLAGSGPCDRDSTIGETKPLKDLALGLSRHGIASIRFDKVTHAHGKAFRTKKYITLTDEYIPHALDAIKQAQNHTNIEPSQIFVLGHSLGAVVAPTLVSMDLNPPIAGCVIMAGPAEPIYKSYIRQLRYIESLDGPESVYAGNQIEDACAKAAMADSESLSLSTAANKLPFGIGPAYWLDYRRFDPLATLAGLNCPALIMQGGRDYQVVRDDYEQWCAALDGRGNAGFRFYEGPNHHFVFGTGGFDAVGV
ncbi:hypothetical protein N7509_005152 [Penicillium cosmopolitanum]|uniref:AB hydrolase-1 domain-containing protein n=1 Tax=Penicillium cosmopolitanum TaxID=1131564 RepID=A0A9X0B9T1_9EURO|nr:uncharacterized protein N7509_005152 [Penicillium cosmopolitanum]KAJ5397039.1 hypothetical protein N7509_005152 [Penicillium cosmopolitanum]